MLVESTRRTSSYPKNEHLPEVLYRHGSTPFVFVRFFILVQFFLRFLEVFLWDEVVVFDNLNQYLIFFKTSARSTAAEKHYTLKKELVERS